MNRERLRTRLAEFYEELLELADHAEWNDWHETFQQNIVATTIVGVFVLLVGSCAVSATVSGSRAYHAHSIALALAEQSAYLTAIPTL